MNKEDSLDFKQTFNIDFSQIPQEEPVQKSRKKKYIIAGIILGVIAITVATVLLVGHYKYNLFSSETYQVASIKRELYSAEYFTETKSIKTKMTFSQGDAPEEKEQILETDFVVMITDKKETENKDILNTATLIPLASTVKAEGKEAIADSFNIFDENIVKEFEANPDGSKYPMAKFHFYENGTIKDIQLPKEMDRLSAENMVELIENVIPKLTRNRAEDEKNGLEIKTKNGKKKKTFIEYQPTKEFVDRYTSSKYEGSKFTKSVERVIEDEKLSEINSKTELYLETQAPEDKNNYIDFGIKDFHVDSSSKIISTKNLEDKKEDINLIERLSSKFNFIDSEVLIKSLMEQEYKAEEEAESKEQLRNLANWPGSINFSKVIFTANILGKSSSLSYNIKLSSQKLRNYLNFNIKGLLDVNFGNEAGVSGDTSNKNAPKLEKKFTYPLTAGVDLSIKVAIVPSFTVTYNSKTYVYTVKLSGTLKLTLAAGAGISKIIKIEGGATVDLFTLAFTTTFSKNSYGNYYLSDKKLSTSVGKIQLYINLKLLDMTLFETRLTVFDGWDLKR